MMHPNPGPGVLESLTVIDFSANAAGPVWMPTGHWRR